MSDIITIPAIRAITSKTINEVSDIVKSKIQGYQALKKISDNNDDLMASIANLMLVKTLFSGPEKPVNLFDFFQKPKLEYLGEKVFSIDSLNEIGQFTDIKNKNLIFRGTVGQGKSILMRSLAMQDIFTNHRIPIFIELKNVSKNKNVKDLIKEYLATWVGDSNEIFNLVLKSGKVSIFLDAFDEIDIDLTKAAYKEINDLCQNYRQLTVIVSSRPDTIIINNQYFDVIDLLPYDFDEQVGLIRKLVKNEGNKKFLIDAITKSTHEVKEVLTTPLMVILFIKQYTVGFTVPNHVVDFYKNIFDVVTFTHDRSKGIEKRKSFSSLNQTQLENVFERFCFETFLAKKTVFSKDDFIGLLNKSIEKCKIENFKDYIELIDDYTKFACLILQDGTKYTFIHKSIQEFYVARFISNLNEKSAEKIIELKMCNEYVDDSYLEFLKILKPYYYNKYYLLRNFDNYSKITEVNFIDNLYNFKEFMKVFFICNDLDSKTLGFLLFGDILKGFDVVVLARMLNNLVELNILNSPGMIPVEKDNKGQYITAFDNVNPIPLLDLYTYDELIGIQSIKNLWGNICENYDKIVLEVKSMENQVTEEDLGI